MMDDRAVINQLISDAEASIAFLSNPSKKERERLACIAFLRCLGVSFQKDHVISIDDDPPDVRFDGANFEVKEYLDDNRRRHDEYKKKLERLEKAQKLSDLLEPYTPLGPLVVSEVAGSITEFLEEWASIYGKEICSTLDALVYFNLAERYLTDEGSRPGVSDMVDQGWRSVSTITNTLSYVFFASPTAPDFLRNNVAQTKKEWSGSGLFELT